MVIRQGMATVVTGVAVGLFVAWGLSRIIAGLVWGIGPTDPATFVGASTTLILFALLAVWLPARRAIAGDLTEPMKLG